jgi:hypothetical protein
LFAALYYCEGVWGSLLCELGLDKVKRGEEKEVEEEKVQEENKSVAIAIFNTVTFTTPPPPHPPLHRRRRRHLQFGGRAMVF